MARPDGRTDDELRPITFERDFTEMADGSCLVTFGRTRVLCTASVDEDVPRWMRGTGKGWVTAEYSMLPGSSPERVCWMRGRTRCTWAGVSPTRRGRGRRRSASGAR